MNPPGEELLASVERELRKLPPGTQRAVGGGVYMRLDGARGRSAPAGVLRPRSVEGR